MRRLRLLITRKNEGPSRDDKVFVDTHGENNTFKVTFVNPEEVSRREFIATEVQTLNYLGDILYSLSRDTDPFEKIQLSSTIHPCVIYPIADLFDGDIRELIMNMIRDAIRFRIEG